MFAAIIAQLGGAFISKFIDGALEAFKAYENKQISLEELKDRLLGLMVGAARDIEVSHSETLAKTYATFWQAADSDKSNIMKIMWASALGSQIFVLFWAQWCAPLLYAYGYMDKGWRAGTTVEWAYLLIGALLGLGPMVLRNGPAAGSNVTAALKNLLGK